jgi:hypothetical protein
MIFTTQEPRVKIVKEQIKKGNTQHIIQSMRPIIDIMQRVGVSATFSYITRFLSKCVCLTVVISTATVRGLLARCAMILTLELEYNNFKEFSF